MGESKVREPMQQRSIEKKKKILEAGYAMFCEKGYHKTNTAEIAKRAGVSTGIVYNYFHNKKDIFMECLQHYAGALVNPVYDMLRQIEGKEDLKSVLVKAVDYMIASHIEMRKPHEEMEGMAHSDPDVSAYYEKFEEDLTEQLVEILESKGISDPHIHEKLHVLYRLMENICHEIAFHQHGCIRADVMKEVGLDSINHLIDTMGTV